MTGKAALVRQLVADGVRHVFGNPGTLEQGFIAELPRHPEIEFVPCLHEGVAISMAEAYARATGRAAFVQLHTTPGLGNALGMLNNVRFHQAPLVVYVGQSDTRVLAREPYLSGPLVELARPLVRWATQVSEPADVPQALRRAFTVAMSPPRGPVLLVFPIDTLDREAEMEIRPSAILGLRREPDPEAIVTAAELVRAARHPALLVGDGVAEADGQDAVIRLAERLQAPVLSLASTRDLNAPADHSLVVAPLSYLDEAPLADALAGHDLILSLGARDLTPIFPHPDRPPLPDARLIQVELDPAQIGKTTTPDLAMLADPASAAEAMLAALPQRSYPPAPSREAEADEAHPRAFGPIAVAHTLRDRLQDTHTVFIEALSDATTFERVLRPSDPRRFLKAGGPGIGPGLPGAVGVQLAWPDRRVVAIVSDGASLYSLTALWTAAHLGAPVVFLILDNGEYRVLKSNLTGYYGEAEPPPAILDLQPPRIDFARLAEGFGLRAWTVANVVEFEEALQAAFAATSPALIDVRFGADTASDGPTRSSS